MWNLVFLIQLPSGVGHVAQSNRMSDIEIDRYKVQCMDEVVCWDGGWLHRGTGNRTTQDRIQLHIVFAPKWMIIDMSTEELEWFGVNSTDVRLARAEIAREYNSGTSIDETRSGVGYWVNRLRKKI